MGADTGGLRIAALGPLRAWRGDRPLDTGPAQQRAVLTSLTLRCGQVASADELVRDVWGPEPPASAHAAVRNHISRLRTVLESGSAAPTTLVSVAGGYALHLPDGALDVSRAERLHARAQAARSHGDLEAAVRFLVEAEALWDGTPLTGVPGPYAQRQRDRLTEYRLLLVEARLSLELQLGGHSRVVGELLTLADEHPLREGLRALQMLALYRCGRQADALAGYTEARRHLAAELGVDPGPELERLHQRMLEADPALAPQPGAAAAPPAPGPAAGPDRPPWVPPAQIPPDAPDFTGRREEGRHVRHALAGAVRTDATAPVVCVIHGMGGVGKTALAVHAAHAVREQFPDGQLYADLRGAGRERADPYEVQELFLRSLGVLASNVPGGREERTALYRSRMAGRRLLLLLDNAADTEQVSALLPGTAGSAALVTSRTALTCLPATTCTALEPFSEQEALALLERIAGSERCRQEQRTARDLVRACGMLPLAVRVVGARLAARPRWTLATLAERLSDRSQRLGELEAGSLAVESVFHFGYSSLDEPEARAFRLLAIPEVPDLSPPAAAAVLDCDRREAEALLEALVHHGLLEPGEPGRYRYHDLLRLFARHRTLDTDPAPTRQAALSRIARFHLTGTSSAMRAERPYSRLPDTTDADGSPGAAFTDALHAQEWMLHELPAMLAVAGQILHHPYRPVSAEDTRTLSCLLALLMTFTDFCLPWDTIHQLGHTVLRAADHHGERLATVFGCIAAAVACAQSGHHEEAAALAARADATLDPADRVLAVRTVYTMGVVATVRPGNLGEAIGHFRSAHALACGNGEHGMAAQCSISLARAELALDRPHQALEAARDALARCTTGDNPVGIALARRVVGDALERLGRYEEAVTEYGAALAVCRAHGLHAQRARTLLGLASVLTAVDRPEQARTCAAEAGAALAQLGDATGEAQARAVLDRLPAAGPSAPQGPRGAGATER
ncbi:NB-ARC domain-containing protein [Streptomyces sp. RS10V-4]|uniref:AfsR/SARP family transcriptional regulator n=1 Tax=Streptomyces rhizoryzae TaxID=2932493 RepID=UPI00200647F9|nr:BTAD domain-containing putative transcriptional regulator [Streptomyces rhizoryzae]MCK7621825.1 NB-ARC domain-containing protein [Streptomyces rhizoryzae]